MEYVIKIYDDDGRTKLPRAALRALKLGKGSKLRVIIEKDKIVLVPIRVKWPKLENVDEDEALASKHLAWYGEI